MKKNKKFFTKEERANIPTLGENRGENAIVYAKFVNKNNDDDDVFYVTEYEHKLKIAYGLVVMPEQIFKTLINFKEIKKNKKYERDLDFKQTLLSDIEKEFGYKDEKTKQ